MPLPRQAFDSNIRWMAERLGEKAEDIADCHKLLFCDVAVGQPPKGKGKGVPQLGDFDGPLLVDRGWCKGYKLWVGDLPRTPDIVDIGKLCLVLIDVSVNNQRSRSGHAFAAITFEDLALALEAFERMQWTKFDHGVGQMHWPYAKWLGRGKHQ